MGIRTIRAVLHRVFVVLSVASLACVVLYFTPLPELYHANCERTCHELDWPMICRVKLSLEAHQIMGSWCGDCPNNLTDCERKSCLTADGSRRRVLSANRQLPGPAIQVCENDILVVDVTNRINGQSASVHWRGQSQKESPYMDGVSMITQCPIPEHTTFQYKFRASQAGTHLWQVHTGNNQLDGLFGPFIVRQADRREVHRHLYDIDDSKHYVVINEWSSPDEDDLSSQSVLLINGRAYTKADSSDNEVVLPFTKYNVTSGKRHRFRIAYASGNTGCPVSVQVQNHRLVVIAIDGHPIEPKDTESIVLTPGERADCILLADQKDSQYWLEVKTDKSCRKQSNVRALVSYLSTEKSFQSSPAPFIGTEHFEKLDVISSFVNTSCTIETDDNDCKSKITSLTKLPLDLAADKLDVTLYLPFDFVYVHGTNNFPDDTVKPRINNITFMFPSSPLVSQPNDLEETNILCNENKRPAMCIDNSICECVHVIDIPLHSRVELLLIDKGGGGNSNSQHVFHLHGGSFYVVGAQADIANNDLDVIKELNAQNTLMTKNLKNPMLKDTVAVPPSGIVAVRFRADNPGYWLLHDQKASHWSQGLDVVLHVGNHEDLPPVPENFPRCGSWIGPEYFLI